MYDYKQDVHHCDFCQKSINHIHYIYNKQGGRGNESCRSCRLRRFYNDDLVKIKGKFYWK